MKDFPKQFDFKEEGEIYKRWEESGFFNPDNLDSNEKYCNVLPPPNANGELHIGHASGYAVMDILGRYERMKGKKVLLLPGKDHAGILTQVVYEKKIKENRGITRQDLGREKFYREAYDFCIDRANFMRAQEKALGVSADWSREKFTLDPQISKTVLETFVKMYDDGLIYKGKRIINWCPRCATALSDLEVIHKQVKGKLYYIKYPIKDTDDFITIATTRPETMLGDTAVAINPGDKENLKYKGKAVILPLMNREIPIIADRRVEIGFGTGAVKITPAHDPLDWKIGKDNNLEVIQVINEEAKITKDGGKYADQDVLEARENIIKDLKALDLFEKEEETQINISICERCKEVMQPLISEQWFINVDTEKYSIKKKCLEAIKNDTIKFYPEYFKDVMIRWFENLDDWCISRQIWWGHRIPVYYRKNIKSQISNLKSDIYVGLEPPKEGEWVQEEDTFDAWFSSGQWAYTTLGYPDGKDYQEYYPTDTMTMGRDILFFWACRMIIMSLYRTGKVPFENLYFTGLVRDKNGLKMSKSKGNGIDPLEMTKKFGTDALRLSLVSGTTPGQDFKLYEEKIASYRNFVTKLWNIARYASQSDENFALVSEIKKEDIKSLADKYIVNELEIMKDTIGKEGKDHFGFMQIYEISLSQERLRRFTWDQLADWYVEIHKIEKNQKVLGYVLDQILKLWHPFMPFVTEKIWDIFNDNLLMMQKYPARQSELADASATEKFEDLQNVITGIRNIRASYHIKPADIIEAYGEISENKEIIEKLARIKIIAGQKEKLVRIKTGNYDLGLDIAKKIDVKKEFKGLKEEERNLNKLIEKNQKLLNDPKFSSSAPEEVRNQTDKRITEYKAKLSNIQELIKNLNELT